MISSSASGAGATRAGAGATGAGAGETGAAISPSMLAEQGENSIMPSSSTGGTATGAGAGEGEALDAPSVSDTPEALGVACAPAPRVESDAASVAMLLRGADGFQCAIWSAAMAVPATASTVPNRSVCRCVM